MSDPYNPDHLRDALDHIMRTARASRTGNRRCDWIAYRAHCALTGKDDWKEERIPRMGYLKQVRELKERIEKAEDLLRRAAYSIGDRALPDSADHALFEEIDLFLDALESELRAIQ